MCVLFPYLFPAIFLILHIHGGPLSLYMKLPVSSCCSFSFASLIRSFSSSHHLAVRSCVITTLLNGLSAYLILFKFRNISHFFVSSSIAISNGVSLFSVAFPNLTALLTSLLAISILQMFLHSPTIFWISSSLLVSGSGLSHSGSPKTIIFFLLFCLLVLSISLSFSEFSITSSTFVLVSVIVDHGLSSLSSPPSFLILSSIFSILLYSLVNLCGVCFILQINF